VNLNTTSTRRANAIAYDVREKGRPKREGNPLTGKIVTDKNGGTIMIPGSLKSVKAIGWYIEEYGIAQISMNLTNISVTPVHIAFDEVCRKAETRGVRVTGSELVGLIPLKSLLDAGRYYLDKQQLSSGVSDDELIKIAIRSMGLNDIHHFNPEEKVIEFVMADKKKKRLVDLSLEAFMNETASDSPAPGGGSVSSYMGALGTSLGTMVANLSAHKKGWDERWKEFSDWAVTGKEIQNKLLNLVDEDTEAFNKIMEAFSLPKKSDEEKNSRDSAIQEATKNATLVPLKVMETAFGAFGLINEMVEKGNPNSISDAGVGALGLRACIKGAFLNVKINASGLKDKEFVKSVIEKGTEIESKAETAEQEILKFISDKMGI
jgi:glutamate formiminotransferase/formiminotetrahydrofolate cyclodeaminase